MGAFLAILVEMPSHKGRKTMKLPRLMNTMRGLESWFRIEHQKLGWMVLAKAKGMDYKVSAYKHAIEDLKNSIEHVMNEYKDHNRIHDLNVMFTEVQVLQEFVKKHL